MRALDKKGHYLLKEKQNEEYLQKKKRGKMWDFFCCVDRFKPSHHHLSNLPKQTESKMSVSSKYDSTKDQTPTKMVSNMLGQTPLPIKRQITTGDKKIDDNPKDKTPMSNSKNNKSYTPKPSDTSSLDKFELEASKI